MTEPITPAGAKDDGISKYMKRMKTVLRGPRSNRNSVSSLPDSKGDSGAVKVGTASNPSPKLPAPGPAQTPKKAVLPRVHETTGRWSTMQEEKARALFAKYGLTLEPGEWVTPRSAREDVERVEKPIRMRIRRICHRCHTTFGADKVCVGCSHLRCTKCHRYPPAKPKPAPEVKGEVRTTERAIDMIEPRPKKPVLTIRSRTGGQDLVRKPILQRVRRTCHMCSTMFAANATECRNCHHIRCKKCPRDPAKKDKYPDGYPGDAEPPFEPPERVWRKPRRRIRWTCDSCSSLFAFGEKVCSKCQHERCKDCIRDPPKKIKPEPDPELLRRVEEKLAAMNMS
ncbi:hypothetical protein LOZ53_002940 [Ophidiomyces ophidiicola]|nr:hypothetical protein LOZ55_005431 [Ophidiomyces ophidiicola]KAI1988636.1 hypothetical protein LOZ51_005453 [Ophidiomyces ophidiicola]KAI1990006.1 hypothetical protein LOZ54_002702 [Ophidiomyces ophidiicola]KAI1991258.1 hypothetical protein LOZ53_002940 [Ophidiomyces ophidiicola]